MSARLVRSEPLDPIAAADARWLHRLVLRALRTSVLPAASALSLSACAADASGTERLDPVDDDPPSMTVPGPRKPGMPAPVAGPLSVCENGQQRSLASGMSLVREVDYVADVNGGVVVSERGVACSGASDFDECAAALSSAKGGPRRLVTTEGDAVRVWMPQSPDGLLGEIDALEEAVWLALARGYTVDCGASVTRDDHSFVIDPANREVSNGCSLIQASIELEIAGDGESTELDIEPKGQGCSVGRRPIGRCDLRTVRARSLVGAYFARAAQLEAASVPAFAQIGDLLRRRGAPARLIAAAQRAGRDEVRHARVTARLAQRFGAEPRSPRVAAGSLRSLATLAFDNAREGCVFETYAALEASHQAVSAGDARVRRALRMIACDELRHAAFSHALHAWLCDQLGDAARDELAQVRADAVSQLHASLLAAADAPSLNEVAGLPTRRTALALHGELGRTVWA